MTQERRSNRRVMLSNLPLLLAVGVLVALFFALRGCGWGRPNTPPPPPVAQIILTPPPAEQSATIGATTDGANPLPTPTLVEALRPPATPIPPGPTAEPTAIVAIPADVTIGAAANLPRGVLDALGALPAYRAEGDAALTVHIGAGNRIGTWVYALVAPFATVTDDVTLNDVLGRWHSGDEGLVASAETTAVFAALWGGYGAGLRIIPEGDIVERLWQPDDVWALVPFSCFDAADEGVEH